MKKTIKIKKSPLFAQVKRFDPAKVKDTLPDKLSDLIEVALKDLIAVEKNKKFKVDMGSWYEPEDKKCLVCFAGSVMVNSLGCNLNESISPEDFPESLENKFAALDNVREGYLCWALDNLNIGFEVIMSKNPLIDQSFVDIVDITPYHRDSKKFKKEMAQLAKNLRELGL